MASRKASARTSTTDLLAKMVQRLVERVDPLQVIVFGSHARGRERPDSDLDLLVVVPDGRDKDHAWSEAREALRGSRTSSDVVIATPGEIARRGNLVGPVLRPALRHGKVVYDASIGSIPWLGGEAAYPPTPRGGPVTDEERLQETRRWLRQASQDLRAARMLAHGEDAAPNVAAFHAQQAAEKALKAVLVFLQVPFEKTHNLDDLRNLVPEGWLTRERHPALEWLSEWAVKARYPGDWPEPTESDAQAAAQEAHSIWESVGRDLEQHGFEVPAP